MSAWDAHIILDVEADGPCPGLFNMISFGLVSLANPERAFLGEVAPVLDHPGIEAGREVSGISFATQKTYRPPALVMTEAHAWVREIAGAKRPVFWSDNPAFDWQFWNWYSQKFVGANPGGHSARRIGDLDAGRRGEPLNASAWKKRRVTTHTHNPVDDARGNAEALRWILTEMGERFA
ncbi:MAG: hypothetical protein JNJ73_03080 [Hyphomonadaceae bacterium]|nr:hypothetical protein [Hyphomonadaceae bacterium]